MAMYVSNNEEHHLVLSRKHSQK